MSEVTLKKAKRLQGCLTLPGDKSISHRAAILSLISRGAVEVRNFNDGADCRKSLMAVGALGGGIETAGSIMRLVPPTDGLRVPEEAIDCGNSGTTLRLLAGLVAGAGISARLTGDESLSRRPMARIIAPLKDMNADIEGSEDGTAPVTIGPGNLIDIDYTLPVASAQVKSALLLAGLASGTGVTIREKQVTRDHTERMIAFLGGGIGVEDVKPEIVPDPKDPRKKKRVLPTREYRRSITLSARTRIEGGTVDIPGDFSTAAGLIGATLLVPGSHLILKEVGINPTRTGFLTVLKQMGADITVKNRHEKCGEPCGDIEVRHSRLKPRKISGSIIPGLIDEIPIIAVIAATLEGTTIVRDAEELRHKESDRIHAIVQNLTALGIKTGEFPDGFAVEGHTELNGGEVDSFGDHRIAMAFAAFAMAAHGKTVIKNSDVVDISCPRYFAMLEGLRQT